MTPRGFAPSDSPARSLAGPPHPAPLGGLTRTLVRLVPSFARVPSGIRIQQSRVASTFRRKSQQLLYNLGIP